jgi:hypothetical protein
VQFFTTKNVFVGTEKQKVEQIKMKDVNELNLEIERIKGDISLIRQSIRTIETNHLAHVQKDICAIKKVLWTVGFMVLGQFIMVVKDLLLQ